MKAFVIKNKEGKYFVNRYVQAKKIWNAFIFEDKNDAKEVKGKDDEVVEITIAEGDLEQENKELKKVLKEMYKDLSNACQALPPYEWYIKQGKESMK